MHKQHRYCQTSTFEAPMRKLPKCLSFASNSKEKTELNCKRFRYRMARTSIPHPGHQPSSALRKKASASVIEPGVKRQFDPDDPASTAIRVPEPVPCFFIARPKLMITGGYRKSWKRTLWAPAHGLTTVCEKGDRGWDIIRSQCQETTFDTFQGFVCLA